MGSPDKRIVASSTLPNQRLPSNKMNASNISTCFPTVFGNPEYINYRQATTQSGGGEDDNMSKEFCPPPPLPIRDDGRYLPPGSSCNSVFTRPSSSEMVGDEDLLNMTVDSGLQMAAPPPPSNGYLPLQPPSEFNDKTRSHSSASGQSRSGSYVRRKHDSSQTAVKHSSSSKSFNNKHSSSSRSTADRHHYGLHKPSCHLSGRDVYEENKLKPQQSNCKNSSHIYAFPAQIEGSAAALCSTASLPQLSYEREYGGVSHNQYSNGSTPQHDLVDDEECLYNGMQNMMVSARKKHQLHSSPAASSDKERHQSFRGGKRSDYMKLQRRAGDDNSVLAVYCRTSEPRKEQELFIQYPIKETSLFSNSDGSRRRFDGSRALMPSQVRVICFLYVWQAFLADFYL